MILDDDDDGGDAGAGAIEGSDAEEEHSGESDKTTSSRLACARLDQSLSRSRQWSQIEVCVLCLCVVMVPSSAPLTRPHLACLCVRACPCTPVPVHLSLYICPCTSVPVCSNCSSSTLRCWRRRPQSSGDSDERRDSRPSFPVSQSWAWVRGTALSNAASLLLLFVCVRACACVCVRVCVCLCVRACVCVFPVLDFCPLSPHFWLTCWPVRGIPPPAAAAHRKSGVAELSPEEEEKVCARLDLMAGPVNFRLPLFLILLLFVACLWA